MAVQLKGLDTCNDSCGGRGQRPGQALPCYSQRATPDLAFPTPSTPVPTVASRPDFPPLHGVPTCMWGRGRPEGQRHCLLELMGQEQEAVGMDGQTDISLGWRGLHWKSRGTELSNNVLSLLCLPICLFSKHLLGTYCVPFVCSFNTHLPTTYPESFFPVTHSLKK